MRLKALTLKNFRGYFEETTLEVSDFTSIIGRNDVGKSTLLEALDIFFNGGKPDAGDAHIDHKGEKTQITCRFEDLPTEIIIDATAKTTLVSEYLLNSEGELEIVKEYDLSATKITAKVFARALHPNIKNGEDLLQLSNADLKKRATSLGIDLSSINQRENARIRKAIWNHLDKHSGLNLTELLIPLNKEDAKQIWGLLEKEMPIFALFRADRQSHDNDDEVTDPFNIAIKATVKDFASEIAIIKKKVEDKVTEVVKRTLAKLHEMDPALAASLQPIFTSEPKWDLFKFSLNDDRNIPINKRGSGVRRMILLNFFRAEAEKQQEEAKSPSIIYAIEEPESSQHPDNQRLLINALLDLSRKDKTQVIITTHVPGIAALVPQESVRLVEHDSSRPPRVRSHNTEIMDEIADQLGILPDMPNKQVKLLLYVEGPNDVVFFKKISNLFGIDLATDQRVAFVVAGGGNLKHWVNHQYLKGLGLPEIHIYDRDLTAAYGTHVALVNARGNGDWATLTDKREIENYLHSDAIRGCFGVSITFTDADDVPRLVANACSCSKAEAKKRLCDDVAARMTLPLFHARGATTEIEKWFDEIKKRLI